LWPWTVAVLIAWGAARLAAADEQAELDLARFYGFGELEIFKLERRSHSMIVGDFNSDGRSDLALADNSHSRIDLLIQRTAPPTETDAAAGTAVNEISSHWRFDHQKVPVDHNISAMATGDFNADGRDDLAYFGDPDRLILRLQPAAGDWSEKREFRLADVEPQSWCVAAGDLDSDGRDDLAVLGTRVTYLLRQTAPGEFGTPDKVRNTAERLGLAMIADVSGDDRNDLFYFAADGDSRRASVRLQSAEGTLGPETRFGLKDTRGLVLYDLLPESGEEVVSIDGNTGRLQVSQFVPVDDQEDVLDVRLVQYGFGESGGAKGRDFAMGDLDGDERADIIVTDPELAQLIVFRQHPQTGLDLGMAFPSFLGVEQVRVMDVDGDGRAEVFALTSREKSIGWCRLESERLTFPISLPVTGEPVAMELADLKGDGQRTLVYLEKVRRGRYALHRLTPQGTSEWQTERLGDELELDNEPNRLVRLDANEDGRTDLLLISGVGRPPKLLVTQPDGTPRVVETQGGLQLGELTRGAVSSGQLEGPVTLFAQENFARSMRLDEHGRWQVRDQFNPAESGAKVAGAVALDVDGAPGNELVLIDTGVNKLRVLRKEGGLYQPWRERELGTFPYLGAEVADLNADGRDDLLLFGSERVMAVFTGTRPPALTMRRTFESKLENTFFADLVAGDLNGDGRPDVAMFDTRSQYVEIVTPWGGDLRKALSFKVFEEKTFGRRRTEGDQPREATIADVTGDGRQDLILLVHDRVLVYPQDDGLGSPDPPAKADPATADSTE
jgi:hypothetical protein